MDRVDHHLGSDTRNILRSCLPPGAVSHSESGVVPRWWVSDHGRRLSTPSGAPGDRIGRMPPCLLRLRPPFSVSPRPGTSVDNRATTSSRVSLSRIGTLPWARIGPVSKAADIRCTVNDIFGSPLRSALSSGNGPRYSGQG